MSSIPEFKEHGLRTSEEAISKGLEQIGSPTKNGEIDQNSQVKMFSDIQRVDVQRMRLGFSIARQCKFNFLNESLRDELLLSSGLQGRRAKMFESILKNALAAAAGQQVGKGRLQRLVSFVKGE